MQKSKGEIRTLKAKVASEDSSIANKRRLSGSKSDNGKRKKGKKIVKAGRKCLYCDYVKLNLGEN